VRPEGISQWKNPTDPIGKRTFRATAYPRCGGQLQIHSISSREPRTNFIFQLVDWGETNTASVSKTELVMKFHPDLEILQEELRQIVNK